MFVRWNGASHDLVVHDDRLHLWPTDALKFRETANERLAGRLADVRAGGRAPVTFTPAQVGAVRSRHARRADLALTTSDGQPVTIVERGWPAHTARTRRERAWLAAYRAVALNRLATFGGTGTDPFDSREMHRQELCSRARRARQNAIMIAPLLIGSLVQGGAAAKAGLLVAAAGALGAAPLLILAGCMSAKPNATTCRNAPCRGSALAPAGMPQRRPVRRGAGGGDRPAPAGMADGCCPGQSPVTPSRRSRSRSAWPLWRAYSSIMCR
ncbi:hypothetical protein [Actinoplanes sp. NPDC051494]|uniref:hypothetical protein n=1 Tax=Actinoplanes sp. NPDC051494 TaxID=3363907 RepID=UPI0037AFA79B